MISFAYWKGDIFLGFWVMSWWGHILPLRSFSCYIKTCWQKIELISSKNLSTNDWDSIQILYTNSLRLYIPLNGLRVGRLGQNGIHMASEAKSDPDIDLWRRYFGLLQTRWTRQHYDIIILRCKQTITKPTLKLCCCR